MVNIEYVYILQEREFINSDNNIYKIGKSKQENNKRFFQYPKGSVLLLQIKCDNCDELEKKIIIAFKSLFKQRKDIGTEYFEGELEGMIDVVYYLRKKTNSNIENKIDVILEIEKQIIMKEELKQRINIEKITDFFYKNTLKIIKNDELKEKDIIKKNELKEKNTTSLRTKKTNF